MNEPKSVAFNGFVDHMQFFFFFFNLKDLIL